MTFAPVIILPADGSLNQITILTLPSLSGVARVGEVITCSIGTWLSKPAAAYTFQWRSDGINISGQIATTLILSVANLDTDIDCVVTATNLIGSTSATSGLVEDIAEAVASAYPVITSDADQSVDEDKAFSIDLAADEEVTWTIVGGADASVFDISSNAVNSSVLDYELPLDANFDNVYEFTIRATSVATGLFTDLDMTLTVLNVPLLLVESNDVLLTESGDRLALEAA
jgi:hypothetical protein